MDLSVRIDASPTLLEDDLSTVAAPLGVAKKIVKTFKGRLFLYYKIKFLKSFYEPFFLYKLLTPHLYITNHIIYNLSRKFVTLKGINSPCIPIKKKKHKFLRSKSNNPLYHIYINILHVVLGGTDIAARPSSSSSTCKDCPSSSPYSPIEGSDGTASGKASTEMVSTGVEVIISPVEK